MAKLSGAARRTKGHGWERFVARAFRKRWPHATVRRALQSEQAYEPDVVIEGDCSVAAQSLWTECETGRNCKPHAKMAQALRDIGRANVRMDSNGRVHERIPIVVWRKHRSPKARVSIRLGDFLRLVTCQGSAERHPALVELDLGAFLEMVT